MTARTSHLGGCALALALCVVVTGCAVRYDDALWLRADAQQNRFWPAVSSVQSPSTGMTAPLTMTRLADWVREPRSAPWPMWSRGEAVPDLAPDGDVLVFDVDGDLTGAPSEKAETHVELTLFAWSGEGATAPAWGEAASIYTCERLVLVFVEGTLWTSGPGAELDGCPTSIVDTLPAGAAFVPAWQLTG